MDTKLPRALGAFAVFFTLALPLFAALVASAVYTPLVNMVTRSGAPKGALADFFFNDFKLALAIPLLIGVGGAAVAFLAWRKRDADTTLTLARLLVVQTLVCFASFLWFAAYLVAAVKG
jgi:hypothetical protein